MNVCAENISKEQDDFLCCQNKPIWLQEKSLHDILRKIYPNETILYNKTLKIPGLNSRPDFLIENKNILVEYQGYHHFIKWDVVNRDNFKRNFHMFSGYTLIEIPYFIQLTKEVTKKLFNINKDFSRGFPHGFLHPKVSMPGEFCKIGYERYKDLLEFYGEKVKTDIFRSLQARADMLKVNIHVIS